MLANPNLTRLVPRLVPLCKTRTDENRQHRLDALRSTVGKTATTKSTKRWEDCHESIRRRRKRGDRCIKRLLGWPRTWMQDVLRRSCRPLLSRRYDYQLLRLA